MFSGEKAKKIAILIGDVVCLYGALIIVLWLRFGSFKSFSYEWGIHLRLFSFVFLGWLIIFYIAHLYEIDNILNFKKLRLLILEFQAINFFLAISFFYIFSAITPKTNLALVSVFSAVLILIWRFFFDKIIGRFKSQNVLVLGSGLRVEELKRRLQQSRSYGYRIFEVIENFQELNAKDLEKIIENNEIKILAISQLMKNPEFYQKIFEAGFSKSAIFDLADFYEIIFKKIPLDILNESWFFSLNQFHTKIYDSLKRIFDFVLAFLGLIISSPFWILISLAVKIDSPGKVFYISRRVGKNNKLFKIIKFRTMRNDITGPSWTKENDKRITCFGRFLRKTHLDELPQLINVLKGEISFVGPRPEEKKLVELFSQKIPFYSARHLISPGLFGWAQYNYPHGASVRDAWEKFQYDLYYLKHRSFWLDLSIIIRAIRIFLTQKTH